MADSRAYDVKELVQIISPQHSLIPPLRTVTSTPAQELYFPPVVVVV